LQTEELEQRELLTTNPMANILGPYSGMIGKPIDFVAIAHVNDTTLQAAGFNYSWKFGDGASATGPTPTHSYASAGVYTVTVTAADTAGGSDTISTTATVGTSAGPAVPTDFQLEAGANLLAHTNYGHVDWSKMAADGAYGVNAAWEQGTSSSWYIEEQRYGEDLISAGLIHNDTQAINAGLTMFNWGFARQAADGSFAGTGDPFHSASLFVEAAAHACLVLKLSPQAAQYASTISTYSKELYRAALWLTNSTVWSQGLTNDSPYTHRRYIVADALAFTSQLVGGDANLMADAHFEIQDGLSLQGPNGVNPEAGGYDSSYQTVGLSLAELWTTYLPSDSLTSAVTTMINNGLAWEQTMILTSGQVSTVGDTRTGIELTRSGAIKGVNWGDVLDAFGYWSAKTGNHQWETKGQLVAQYYYVYSSDNTPGGTLSTVLSLSATPTSLTAGKTLSLTVTAQNPSGTINTGYVGAIHFACSDGHSILPATYTFTAADAGRHTFTITFETAGNESITVTDLSLSTITGTLPTILVNPAAASRLLLTGFPSSTNAGVSGTVTITAEDPFDNLATAYRGQVAFTSSDHQAVLPSSYTFSSTDNGIHSFTVTLGTAGSQSIATTDLSGAITGSLGGILVAPAAVSKLAVHGFPASIIAGVPGNFTVTAEDAYGNRVPTYGGEIYFRSSDGQALLPSSYIFTAADAGVHTFSVTLKTAGTQSISAAGISGNASGSQGGIVVAAAAATALAVIGFPSPSRAGVSGSIVVTALDAFGNVAAGYRGTVHLSSSDTQASLPANYAFAAADAGCHVFSITLVTAGRQSVTGTDTGTSIITGSQGRITVNPAGASTLSVTGFTSGTTAGTARHVTVVVKDAFGNTATGYRGTIHFSSSDGRAVLPGNYTFTSTDAGRHTFTITLKTSGSNSITAMDSGNSAITGTQAGIQINPAAATTLVLSGFPSPITAGVAGNVTITARDAYGNTATGFRGEIYFSSSDHQAILPASYSFTSTDAGMHVFSITLETPGVSSITATDINGVISGAQGNITVNPPGASAMLFPTSPRKLASASTSLISATNSGGSNGSPTGYRATIHFGGRALGSSPIHYRRTWQQKRLGEP
jgi:PKD repeat protein